MFLRGIFSKSSLNIMSAHTLEGLATLDKAEHVPKFVYEYLSEAAEYLNRQSYTAGVGNYVNITKELIKARKYRLYDAKVRRKEYNFHNKEDDDKNYSCTVSDLFIDGEASLVQKPVVSWCAKMRANSAEAIDFRYELEDMIEQFNLARNYLLETYAIDIIRMLYLVMQGRVATKSYLNTIFTREQDMNLLEVLLFLIKFIEFEEYLSSSEEVLTVGW